jgi:hypothetical protein
MLIIFFKENEYHLKEKKIYFYNKSLNFSIKNGFLVKISFIKIILNQIYVIN